MGVEASDIGLGAFEFASVRFNLGFAFGAQGLGCHAHGFALRAQGLSFGLERFDLILLLMVCLFGRAQFVAEMFDAAHGCIGDGAIACDQFIDGGCGADKNVERFFHLRGS